MKRFVRGIAAVALAGGMAAALPAAPAAAGEASGVYICIRYTYVYVSGRPVPTVSSITVATTPTGCDTAVQVPLP